MFLAEARISARLSHRNIVPVVDSGEHEGGVLWLVQIYVRGQDLGRLLGRAPNGIPLPLAGHVVTQLLLGLQAAHEIGVIHRDLKPANVLLSHGADVQITDFGIAKVVSQDQTPSISTVLKGSPGYLAPEVLRGRPARLGTDLFAVGAILHELLTGRNPFIKGAYADRDQIFYSTLNDAVAPPDGVPPEVAAMVARSPTRERPRSVFERSQGRPALWQGGYLRALSTLPDY